MMVQLADGRLRSIPRLITDLAVEPLARATDSNGDGLRVSVRTLLPLAHFLTARSSSLEEIGDARAASRDAGSLDPSRSGGIGAAPNPASGLEEASRERQNANRMRRRRYDEEDGGDGREGAR